MDVGADQHNASRNSKDKLAQTLLLEDWGVVIKLPILSCMHRIWNTEEDFKLYNWDASSFYYD